MIHGDRVQYAVVGDTGPRDIIGEASYATAKSLGIRPDPRGGGTDDDVTYVVFPDSGVPSMRRPRDDGGTRRGTRPRVPPEVERHPRTGGHPHTP